MLRIIHAADFHLDSPFAALEEEKAALRRKEQRQLLETLSSQAAGADLVLLAGDLLDSGVCHAETSEALEDFLNSLPGQVFIAPGNHDYYAPESPWDRMTLRENVHLFTSPQPEPITLPELGCTVWGAAFVSPRSGPKLRGFRVPAESGIQLMVLHGDVNAAGMGYDPIAEEEIAGSALRYLALGHVHACSGLRRSGDTLWAYPGCLMGRGFDETGEKGFLRLELTEEGCDGEFIPLPSRRYERREVDVTGKDSLLSALEEALPPADRENILRLILRGEWPEKPRLEALYQTLADRCFQLELRDETRLQRSIWDDAGEDTLRGCFLRVLRKKYDAADEAERGRITLAARYGLAALDYREEL
ncbi:MAG: metallophosphoesterase family protein [Oscillospiraceae bacterium]|nr:metallophosphoesterase family protein [Oscillospiraceae bacterium]